MSSYRSIIGNLSDRATVISLPVKFNLNQALTHADKIMLATAFARMTGWKHLKSGVLGSKAQVRLLTGLDFMQTEPNLLRDWLRLDEQNSRIKAKLASKDSTFHPKVLIVKAGVPRDTFAVVGSGNLTHGGLCTNTECALYANDAVTIGRLEEWFNRCWDNGTELKKDAITEYSPKFKKAKELAEKIRTSQKQFQKKIIKTALKRVAREQAILKETNKAIAAFNQYQISSEFKTDYAARLSAAKSIRKLLHIPKFDFNRQEFDDFYAIGYLGSLRNGWRDGVFKQQIRLRRALAHLVDERVSVEERVNSVLKGANRINGFGQGGISKILIAANPKKWPVLNGPVETTLKFFGYEAPRGLSIGQKYKVFAEFLERFKAKTGARDFIALDAFFKFWEKKNKKQRGD
jgi:HKD family nuclease